MNLCGPDKAGIKWVFSLFYAVSFFRTDFVLDVLLFQIRREAATCKLSCVNQRLFQMEDGREMERGGGGGGGGGGSSITGFL